jgi:hypothetical protein
MAKFKIGDRVRLIGMGSNVPYGKVGTVCEISTSPDIKWDDYKSNRGSFWAVYEEHLELVTNSEIPLNSIYEIY